MKSVSNDYWPRKDNQNGPVYRDQLLTVKDLDNFKRQLIFEIKNLFKEFSGQPTAKWLRSKDVMKLMQISPGTLQHYRDSGKIPFKKLGGSILYDPDLIQQLLKSDNVASRSDRLT